MTPEPEAKRITISMPSRLYDRVLTETKSQRRPISAYIRNLIEEDLEGRQPFSPPLSYTDETMAGVFPAIVKRFKAIADEKGLSHEDALWELLTTNHMQAFAKKFKEATGQGAVVTVRGILAGSIVLTGEQYTEVARLNDGTCPLVESMCEWTGVDQRHLYAFFKPNYVEPEEKHPSTAALHSERDFIQSLLLDACFHLDQTPDQVTDQLRPLMRKKDISNEDADMIGFVLRGTVQMDADQTRDLISRYQPPEYPTSPLVLAFEELMGSELPHARAQSEEISKVLELAGG